MDRWFAADGQRWGAVCRIRCTAWGSSRPQPLCGVTGLSADAHQSRTASMHACTNGNAKTRLQLSLGWCFWGFSLGYSRCQGAVQEYWGVAAGVLGSTAGYTCLLTEDVLLTLATVGILAPPNQLGLRFLAPFAWPVNASVTLSQCNQVMVEKGTTKRQAGRCHIAT